MRGLRSVACALLLLASGPGLAQDASESEAEIAGKRFASCRMAGKDPDLCGKRFLAELRELLRADIPPLLEEAIKVHLLFDADLAARVKPGYEKSEEAWLKATSSRCRAGEDPAASAGARGLSAHVCLLTAYIVRAGHMTTITTGGPASFPDAWQEIEAPDSDGARFRRAKAIALQYRTCMERVFLQKPDKRGGASYEACAPKAKALDDLLTRTYDEAVTALTPNSDENYAARMERLKTLKRAQADWREFRSVQCRFEATAWRDPAVYDKNDKRYPESVCATILTLYQVFWLESLL